MTLCWAGCGLAVLGAQFLNAPKWLIIVILAVFPVIWVVVASWAKSRKG